MISISKDTSDSFSLDVIISFEIKFILLIVTSTDLLLSLKLACVFAASFFTSSATTLNPFPNSPALLASIAAFRAKRFVCIAILEIEDKTCFVSVAFLVNSSIF